VAGITKPGLVYGLLVDGGSDDGRDPTFLV